MARLTCLGAVAALVLWLGTSSPALRATSLMPVGFEELVVQADFVVRVEILEVKSMWQGEGPNRCIVTKVSVLVERSMVGATPANLTLVFLGGRVGADFLTVTGQPELKVGDRCILFVEKNGQRVCPLVGFGQGHYRIIKDAGPSGLASVARSDGHPLGSLEEISLPLDHRSARSVSVRSSGRGVTVDQFESAIVELARTRGRPVGALIAPEGVQLR